MEGGGRRRRVRVVCGIYEQEVEKTGGGEKVTMKRNGNTAKGVRRENRRGRVTKEQGGRRRREREG